jgi:hypothetical protein
MAFTAEERADSRKGYLSVFARLAPGVSMAQAQQEMSSIAKRLETELEENKGNGVRIASLTDVYVGSYRSRLLLLLGAVAFVLLIACVNVANLLLARGASRGKEIAIRAALGAGRGRVLRQLFTESLVLACIGGAVGLVLAFWGVRLLKATAPSDVPRLDQAGVDLMTVAFALGATLISSIVFGIAPALRTARPDLQARCARAGADPAALLVIAYGNCSSRPRSRSRSCCSWVQVCSCAAASSCSASSRDLCRPACSQRGSRFRLHSTKAWRACVGRSIGFWLKYVRCPACSPRRPSPCANERPQRVRVIRGGRVVPTIQATRSRTTSVSRRPACSARSAFRSRPVAISTTGMWQARPAHS